MGNKFGLKVKLLLLSASLSLLTVLVGGVGLTTSQKVHSEYDSIVGDETPKLGLVTDMYLAFRDLRISLRTVGLADIDQVESEKALTSALESIKNFEETHESYLKLGLNEKEKALHADMQNAWLGFKEVGDRVFGHYKSGTPEDKKKIVAIFLKDCPEKAKIFGETIKALNSYYRSEIKSRHQDASAQASFSNNITLGLILFALVFGLILGFTLSSSTVNELRQIASDLMGNANEVSSTASDLTSSSESLSAAADEQSEAIQKTAASIEQIRSMVQRNSETSVESAALSSQSRDEAIQGQESVNEMIQAMKDIDESNQRIKGEVDDGNRRISEIATIIQEIESKTKVINEIVFQTKLLSFNASVEAARAGENGKGFAVVAEEVGNLANMSGKAAQEITQILSQSVGKVNEIVKDTTQRVGHMMDESKNKVEHGGRVAQACGKVLSQIVHKADELSRAVESISTASKEQAMGVTEIANAIQQLDAATQTNLQEIKHTTSSASGLGDQVKSLNNSGFRLQVLLNGGETTSGTLVNAFVWKAQYVLGVDEMDDEHKILIEKINNLVNGINQNVSVSKIQNLFSDLAGFTKKHFADEEAYMESIDYPELNGHKQIHHNLLAKVGEFGKTINTGSFDSVALVAFLNDWLVKHIMGVDMKYARYSDNRAIESHRRKAA
jgi:hemerythrin-like metal-binding protein